MATADTGGGGGFCTVFVLPPHPVRIEIIVAERSKRILLLVATASLLSLIMLCDGYGNSDRYPSNARWSRMFPELRSTRTQSRAMQYYCPVPLKCMVWVCPTVYAIVIVPGSNPMTFGLKVIVSVQLFPGARLAPQSSVSA